MTIEDEVLGEFYSHVRTPSRTKRRCLKCCAQFVSNGPANRICGRCSGTTRVGVLGESACP